MKRHARHFQAGFTLIELMAVITIIILLAGLVVGGMGFVSERQAKEKAKTQIALLSKALEEYKLDNGTYPPTTNVSKGAGTSSILFQRLYFDGAQDSTGAKRIYLAELDPGTTQSPNKQGWTTPPGTTGTKILDPWGIEYRYITAQNASGAANSNAMNPDFDLWSSGKDADTNPTSPSDAKNRDDIKNF